MRYTVRLTALVLVLLVLLVPLAAQADGPCPDDPELSKNCDPTVPPLYVVINRDFEDLDRPGTGCQPIILDFPDCEECCNEDQDCADAKDYLENTVCPTLVDRVDWDKVANYAPLYEMCCDCSTDPDGQWFYTLRALYQDGTCPVAMNGGEEPLEECVEGLPPGTGIDLPAPVIIGGLAIFGAALLGAGLLVRRRTLRVA
jgi:hypothetical protein